VRISRAYFYFSLRVFSYKHRHEFILDHVKRTKFVTEEGVSSVQP